MLGVCLALIAEESDREKFIRLYNTYSEMMFRIAVSVLRSRALADETVQDCLLKLAEMIGEVPDISSNRTRAMITVMVRNKAINNLKAEHCDTEEFSEDREISDKSMMNIMSELGYNELVEMIDRLRPIYCDVLVLRFLNELDIDEIAEILEIPCKTVETRIFRGRKILKDKLEGDNNGRSN